MGTKTDPFTGERTFAPNKLDNELRKRMFAGADSMVQYYAKQLLYDAGWKFYVTIQRRGLCYLRQKIITIPSWVYERKQDYINWYLAHELAHAYQWIQDGYSDSHGPRFMAMLKSICPKESWHYEIEYKPRNAQAAGIRKPEDDIGSWFD